MCIMLMLGIIQFFNIADIAISVGVAMIVIDMLFFEKKREA